MNFIVAKIPPVRAAVTTRAQPRTRNDALVEAALNVQASASFPFEREDIPKVYFTDENAAIAEAKRLASKYPQVQYGVFRADTIYETTKPDVLVKSYNEDGELTVKKG